MAILQPTENKDFLLIVDADQIGPNRRLDLPPGSPHPMVRNDWGTIDALRGVLGKYYTTYYSSKGDKLYNYGSPTAMKSKAWNGRRYNTRKGGRMRTQILWYTARNLF